MNLTVPFTEIQAAYPEAVAEAMAGLRKGRSKDRNVAPEDMEWSLGWGELIEGDCSFGGLMGRMRESAEDREAKWRAEKSRTVEERVADNLRRIPGVSIEGRYNRVCASTMLPKGEHPEALVNHLRDRHREQYEEDQRILAQTPEEREQAAQEALEALRGTPGFMVFYVPEGE